MMLQGKKVLVTGASSGIGLATARLCVQEGAQVFATGRSAEKLSAAKASLPAGSAERFHVFAADLLDDASAKAIVQGAVAAMGGLTTVVNAAGVLSGAAFGTAACTLANFDANFNANTRSLFNVIVEATPALKDSGAALNASIINVSSVTGQQSFGGVPAYCASKAAVDMLTRCAAVDLAPFGIRANSVAGGVVNTRMHQRSGMSDEAYDAFIQRSIEVTHPLGKALGRIATAEEVADLIVFLASDKAKFITGAIVPIDGGRLCLGAR